MPAPAPDEHVGAKDVVDLLLDAGHSEGVVVVGRSIDQPDDEWLTLPVQRRLDGIWESLHAHASSVSDR